MSSHPKEDDTEPSFRDKIRDDCQVAATGNVSTIFLPRQEQVLQTTHGVSQSGTTSKEGNACRPITFIAAQVRLWRKMDINIRKKLLPDARPPWQGIKHTTETANCLKGVTKIAGRYRIGSVNEQLMAYAGQRKPRNFLLQSTPQNGSSTDYVGSLVVENILKSLSLQESRDRGGCRNPKSNEEPRSGGHSRRKATRVIVFRD